MTSEQPKPPASMQFRQPDERIRARRLETQCVHAGEHRDPIPARPSTTPIYLATTFTYPQTQGLDDVLASRTPGYVYARYASPTTNVLEQALSTLENADAALACSSGMAAMHLAITGLQVRAGDAVLCAADVYGTTYALVNSLLPRLGLQPIIADFTRLDEVEDILRAKRPHLVIFEVLTNPLLKVIDAPAVVELAHRYGARAIIDSTFTTPMAIRPMDFGADVVVHSLTKFLAGHGDVLAGAVLCRAADFEQMYITSYQLGCNLDPHAAYLALRGLKTFPLRFERQCANAMELARFLEQHPGVARVHYPGLPSHPHHPLARRLFQNDLFGAVLSFEIQNGSAQKAFALMERLRIILPATTLGDVQSTILYPAHSSHAALTDAELAKVGISRALVRLSAGIEHVEDLKEDLDQALRSL
ncbi:MAG: trans-sulfuration enzyme family protein [Anaerolineae bacterium]